MGVGENSAHTERMNVLQTREAIEDSLKLLAKRLLGIFDLSGIESCYKKNQISKMFHHTDCPIASKTPTTTHGNSLKYLEYG